MIGTDKIAERGPLRKYARAINQINDQLKGLRIAEGNNYRVKHTALGQILDLGGLEKIIKTRGEIALFKIKIIYDDYLDCRKVNRGLESLEPTWVMRPRATWQDHIWSLPGGAVISSLARVTEQRRSFDINATVTISGVPTVKTIPGLQEVYPRYAIDEYIYGANQITGDTLTVSGYKLKWIDLNIDARHWTFVDRTVEVCVDGVTHWMVIFGSDVST